MKISFRDVNISTSNIQFKLYSQAGKEKFDWGLLRLTPTTISIQRVGETEWQKIEILHLLTIMTSVSSVKPITKK